jgi:RNA polymerase sigma factor (sigma-70 family)
MTDIQIIELLKSRKDEKAFLSLYKHFPMIKKMIVAKGGKPEDAQDIYQEALIILHKKATTTDFKLTSKLSTYLYSVCRFLWKDELKKQGKHLSVEFNEEIDAVEESDLEEIIKKEEQIKIAEKIIAELGDRCRELLLLFYSGTMKLKAIASKMGYSSENTAKNQKYKCLEAAKNKLKEIQHI